MFHRLSINSYCGERGFEFLGASGSYFGLILRTCIQCLAMFRSCWPHLICLRTHHSHATTVHLPWQNPAHLESKPETSWLPSFTGHRWLPPSLQRHTSSGAPSNIPCARISTGVRQVSSKLAKKEQQEQQQEQHQEEQEEREDCGLHALGGL